MQPKETDFITPAEIIDHFPKIKQRFTARELGYLAFLRLIPAKKANKKTYMAAIDIFKLMNCIAIHT